MKIHPTAIIHPDAELHEDVEVQPYTLVGAQVSIGAGTVVGPHCVIEGRTAIGQGNRLYSGAQIGVVSQDKKHRHDLVGRTAIGDGNVFREHTTVSASTMSSEEDDHRVTRIGSDCMFMACSHVGHDCHLGDSIVMANSTALGGHVGVHNGAILGGLTGVHQESVIGELAFIGGMTRVSKDVPPYLIVEGNPARCVGPNTVGLRRAGLDAEARGRIKQMHKFMYRSDLNTTQALHEIERSVEDSQERETFLAFVRQSARGIVK